MHKSRVYDVPHCYNLGKIGQEKVPSCRLIKCLVSVFLHTSLVSFYILVQCLSEQSCPSDYIRHTPCIHHRLQDKTHRSNHRLIKRARQTPSLLTLSPFPLFFHWRSPLPFCLLFLFPSSSISQAMLAVSVSCFATYTLQVATCLTFGPVTYIFKVSIQPEYSLHFFPFVCSVFLVLFFALVVFLSNPFLVILFLQPLPGFQSYKGV